MSVLICHQIIRILSCIGWSEPYVTPRLMKEGREASPGQEGGDSAFTIKSDVPRGVDGQRSSAQAVAAPRKQRAGLGAPRDFHCPIATQRGQGQTEERRQGQTPCQVQVEALQIPLGRNSLCCGGAQPASPCRSSSLLAPCSLPATGLMQAEEW